MAKPEWGLKRSCLSCGARFYDMQSNPIICPSCQAEFDPLALVRPKRARTAASQAKAKAQEKVSPEEAVTEEDELLVDDDDSLDVGDEIDLDNDSDDDILAEDGDGPDLDEDPDVTEALGNAEDDSENHES